ncbi:MAG: DUF1318 domain-containing protein [Phycisphaerae bacterium]
MLPLRTLSLAAGLLSLTALSACKPFETRNTVIIEQPKPLEVNLNVHADINVVITDARKDMQQITGQQPIRNVTAADIGLPEEPKPNGTSSSNPGSSQLPSPSNEPFASAAPVLYLADFPRTEANLPAPARHNVDRSDDLKAAMAARNAQVRALLDTHQAGEAATGLLAIPPSCSLNATQTQLLTTENTDRSELYKIEAAKKNKPVAEIALGYYVARLGYAQKGDWYQKYNKTSKAWEWAKWDK